MATNWWDKLHKMLPIKKVHIAWIWHCKTSLAVCPPYPSFSLLFCLLPCYIYETVNNCTADSAFLPLIWPQVIMAQFLALLIPYDSAVVYWGSSWVTGDGKLEDFHWNKLILSNEQDCYALVTTTDRNIWMANKMNGLWTFYKTSYYVLFVCCMVRKRLN